ncbi:MAG: IPT/TIG domain-containing protein, partial [Candidatus Firestonebacteria bacterium]
DDDALPWSYWNGSVWSAKANITGATDVYDRFSVCVTNDGYIHIVWSEQYSYRVKHTYYNGTSWLGTPTLVQGANTRDSSLATDGVNLWCFWSNAVSGAANIVYKNYNGTSWDSTASNLTNDALNNYRAHTVYSKGDSSTVPVIWYEGTANPYNIKFSKVTLVLPTVTNVVPSTGSNSSTTTVSITGTGFYGGGSSNDVTNVKIDSGSNNYNFSSWSVTSDGTIINAVVPSGCVGGTYNVRVTTSEGTNTTSTVQFVITALVPTVTNVSPVFGADNSVTTISITGTGFYGGTGNNNISNVKIDSGSNNYNLSSWSVTSDTTIINGIVPSGCVVATYDVKVTTSGGTNSTSTIKFEIKAGPRVTNVVPSTGSYLSSTTVSITGLNFYGGVGSNNVSQVKINNGVNSYNFTSWSVTSDTTIINGIVPSGCLAGTYNVQVTTTVGTNGTSDVKFIVSEYLSVTLRNADDTGDYTEWSLGTNVATSTVTIMGGTNCVLVKNDGNVTEDMGLSAACSNWSLGSAVGQDIAVLMGLFNGDTAPQGGDFSTTYDLVSGTLAWATVSSGNGKFEGLSNGVAVGINTGRKLYIYLKIPSSVTSGQQQIITVTISCIGN